MIVKVVTLGCKVNQCESGSIVSTLKKFNYNASEGLEPADVYILNTCSVTAEADRKSRQYISKMTTLNPDCRIIVIGCSAQNKPESFSKPNVCAIGGTHNKPEFALKAVERLVNNNHYNTLSDITLQQNAGNVTVFEKCIREEYPVSDKTRAFVKIQDGCNRFCSYCIIPYLRGRNKSRRIIDILNECEQITSKEVVLTGIDMSSYGKDIDESFVSLIRELSRFDFRKRLGSLECEIVDDDLLCAMRDGNYCPHFHLSLQSGDNEVLRSMNRHYDSGYFYEKVELIRKYFPSAGITTDVIVGFPTETDDRFERSCKFIESCNFSDIHVFPYSGRAGTVAEKKYKPLSRSVIKPRVDRLLDIKRNLHDRFLNDNIGSVQSVYVEDSESGHNVGYTPNYIKVYSSAPCGQITELQLVRKLCDGLYGEVKS